MKKEKKNTVVKYTADYEPVFAMNGDGAKDLIAESYDVFITKDGNLKIMYDTEFRTEFQQGIAGLVLPRSSVSNTRLRMCNSIGFIDSGYRGSWKVAFDVKTSFFERLKYKIMHRKYWHFALIDDLINKGEIYGAGNKCCQFIFIKPEVYDFEKSIELDNTDRGEGGFGSTGK